MSDDEQEARTRAREDAEATVSAYFVETWPHHRLPRYLLIAAIVVANIAALAWAWTQ